MAAYSPVDRVAERLNITPEQLWEMHRFGWISIVEKDGTPFIRGHQEYKARFILHLQQTRQLTPEQISAVLVAEEPPYSLKDVDRILWEMSTGKASTK